MRISISALNLTERIKKNKNTKAKLINNKGNNIDISIEGADNLLILAGWCKVFHHSTEYLIIGRFTEPNKTKIGRLSKRR